MSVEDGMDRLEDAHIFYLSVFPDDKARVFLYGAIKHDTRLGGIAHVLFQSLIATFEGRVNLYIIIYRVSVDDLWLCGDSGAKRLSSLHEELPPLSCERVGIGAERQGRRKHPCALGRCSLDEELSILTGGVITCSISSNSITLGSIAGITSSITTENRSLIDIDTEVRAILIRMLIQAAISAKTRDAVARIINLEELGDMVYRL